MGENCIVEKVIIVSTIVGLGTHCKFVLSKSGDYETDYKKFADRDAASTLTIGRCFAGITPPQIR